MDSGFDTDVDVIEGGIQEIDEGQAAPPDISEPSELDEVLDETFPSEAGVAADAAAVGETDVNNFAESGLTDSGEVADYIENNIPDEHLTDLEAIEYVNDQEAYEEGLMGMWEEDPITGTATTDIYPHDEEGEMYDTIAHEIGHNAEAVLAEQNPEAVEAWNDLYEESLINLLESGGEQDEFVTPYAVASPDEDFAESYATYINDPPLLQATSPDKYEFMGNEVFA